MSTTLSVPVRYRRQQWGQLVQKIQHAFPALILLPDGIRRITGEWHLESVLLGVAEVATSALVVGSLALAIRRLRRRNAHEVHAHHGVDWVDIFLAGMLAVEAYAHQHETGHLPRPTVLLAVLTLLFGIFHDRFIAFGDRRRMLHVTDDGISLPGRPFRYRRLTIPWQHITSVDIDERSARVRATSGRERRFDLAGAVDPEALRAALLEAEARRRAAVVESTAGE